MQSKAYLGGGGSPGGSFQVRSFVRGLQPLHTGRLRSSLALSGLWLFSASSVHVDIVEKDCGVPRLPDCFWRSWRTPAGGSSVSARTG